jgi:branched-chain amino acid transport system permease protein
MQNIIAAIYSPNILQFSLPWASEVVAGGGRVRLTVIQVLIVGVSVAAYGGLMWFAHWTILGKQMRAVASNPFLAEITRLRPRRVHVYVMAIASAVVTLPGVLQPIDLGLQPYNGVTPLLTATIAMIAGGVGSITGAFVLAIAIAELQNLSLLVIPGEWSIGITFFIFLIFMLLRPTGLFAAAR